MQVFSEISNENTGCVIQKYIGPFQRKLSKNTIIFLFALQDGSGCLDVVCFKIKERMYQMKIIATIL